MNFVLLLFVLFTICIVINGFLLNFFENKLPIFFIKLIRYGKFSHKGEIYGFTSKIIFEVPKSWFRHFYCGGILVFNLIFYQATQAYIFNSESPEWLLNLLNITCGTNRKAYSKYENYKAIY